MARVATGDSADHSAFEAASGLSRTGKNYRGKSHRRCYDQTGFIECPPALLACCLTRSNSRRSNVIRRFAYPSISDHRLSRTSRPALATGRLFCGARTWYERPCSRRVTSGASPHRWIIPGARTSRVSARSLAVAWPRPRARFAGRPPAWLLFTLNGRFGSDRSG